MLGPRALVRRLPRRFLTKFLKTDCRPARLYRIIREIFRFKDSYQTLLRSEIPPLKRFVSDLPR